MRLIKSLKRCMMKEKIQALNGTQKNIIEGTLNFYLDDIAKLEPKAAIRALSAITQANLSHVDEELFEKYDVLSSINTIREILEHPCPQNRTENYPYFGPSEDPNVIVYKDKHGKAAYEPKGML